MNRVTAIFDQSRSYAAQFFPRLDCVVLEKTWRAGRNGRAFAYYDYDSHILGVSPRLDDQSDDRIRAIIRHELGHAIDALYAESTVRRATRGCCEMHKHGPEQLADCIAFCIWREPILYDANDVQSLRAGVSPRPLYLGT